MHYYVSPGWLILFAFVAIFLLTVPRVLWPKSDRSTEREKSIELAKLVASWPQRIRSRSLPGMLVLSLRANSEEMEEAQLVFPPSHPDFERLKAMEASGFAQIHFDFQEEPIPKVEPNDAVAYLRLRSE